MSYSKEIITPVRAYHFPSSDLKLGYGDGREIKVGEKLTVDPERLDLCNYGLHASLRPLDALDYASSNTIAIVELSGKIIYGNDKACASERTVLKIIPEVEGEKLLRTFACDRALSVAHLWDMPDIVREYLETQNEELRAAARDAAWDAARDAARAAARAAAWAAAWDAARDAAWAAARDAAWAAARAAARDAAWDAARDAANEHLKDLIEGWPNV